MIKKTWSRLTPGFFMYYPQRLFACEFLVRLKTDLREFLCLLEKFICLVREELVE